MSETIMDPTTTRYTWTYDEYARLPDDGNRYEVIDGEVLVMPAWKPEEASAELVVETEELFRPM